MRDGSRRAVAVPIGSDRSAYASAATIAGPLPGRHRNSPPLRLLILLTFCGRLDCTHTLAHVKRMPNLSSQQVARHLKQGRSRVTNGSRTLIGVKGWSKD